MSDENYGTLEFSSSNLTDENVEELRQVNHMDRMPTNRDIYSIIGQSYLAYRNILTENLNKRLIVANILPGLLYDYLITPISLCNDM
jgi:hypothetical protein